MKNLSKLANTIIFTSFFFVLFAVLFVIWFAAKSNTGVSGPGAGTVWVFMFVLVSPFILVASMIFGAIAASFFSSETIDKSKKSGHKPKIKTNQNSAESSKYIPIVIGVIALPFLIQFVQIIFFQFISIPLSYGSLWSASQSHDPESCKRLGSDSLKIVCLTKLAIQTKNPAICTNSEIRDLRGQCIAELVISDKQSFDCLQFKGQLTAYEFSQCTKMVAINTNDHEGCKSLPIGEIYDCIKPACNNQQLQGQDSSSCYQDLQKYLGK